ncbi:fungal cellulose binding domain containing protein [Apiospora kogelbergensis]|uniref:lytic cellulose monooxygenase (C4-dehydrogenating) n=1 Tax=Apiospora kogelbergensis TaxID=1337665 RepID=A0AAW0Q6P3_9PEZI
MKAFGIVLFALASAVHGHYTFPRLIANGATAQDWQYVRKTTNYQDDGPLTDLSSEQLRCYQLAPEQGTQTMRVAAGSEVGFTVDPVMSHPGTLQFYMTQVPAGQTAASFDGSGAWFKIFSQGPTISGGKYTWPTHGSPNATVQIPQCLAPGDYLLRVEHIALHFASSVGGAQFYIACGQLTVTGSGTKTFSGVSIPSLYGETDPGILIDIFPSVPTSYTAPGPAVVGC